MAFCHRQLSLQYSNVDARWDVAPILEGDMTQLPPVSSHKIRVFLSSTFSDMTSERNALMEHVYPTLKDFCRKYHLEFQAMDLRWGIREQSHDDHTIIDFCLREIENCKKISLGPNFVILLGQKYGYRPYPPRINSDEFEKIKHELELNDVSATLLNAWFKKNTNVTPNVYMLQPISSLLPRYADDQDKEAQQRAQNEWESISSQIQQLLRMGVSYCFAAGKITSEDKDKYFTSVTEYEIERGLLEAEKPNEEVLCFVRQISNLEKNLHQTRARKFIDSVNDGSEIDAEAQRLLQVLRDDKIPAALSDERNSEFFTVSWKDPEHSNPNDDAEYLRSFCSVFQDKMCWLINQCVQQTRSFSCNTQVIEVLQHLKMGKKLSQDFKGREGTLRKINLYLRSDDDRPMVLFGESGSGKTSVIAKVATRMRKWFVDVKKPIVVLRFLGTTSHSCSIRLVLGSICWHISTVYGHDTATIPGDYPGLVAYFLDLIKVATAESPLILLLDGLDQLSSVHRAHNLAWLPKLLPPHVHIIISTLPDKYELLDTLKLYIPNAQNFLEIPPLGPQLSINLLKDWLLRFGRNLTAEQFSVVEEALSRCTLPLYTSLVFEEVSRWCSYFRAEEIVLEPTVHAIINKLFDRVEKYHGYILVSHTLAYLTASKNGLSDMEVEDILSLDDEVLNDVFQHWLPPVRRIPPLLIPRLQDELSRYLLEREANGIIVFYWYHGQFIEVANKRYLSNEVDRRYVHATLAHYYLGTWGGGKKKPFKFSQKMIQNSSIRNHQEAEADRMVPKQPLDFGPDPKDPTRLNYNLRKLSELPYHLIASHQFVDLKNQVLFNYEWLHAKLSAMSLHEVLSDFQQAQDAGIDDADIQLLSSALRVGGTHLNQNPDMLAFDLLGRLLCYYDKILESPNSHSPPVANGQFDSSPSAPSIGRFRRIRHSNLQSLLHQCDARSIKHSALIPVLQCFDSPSTMSVYILEGHSKVVTDLVFSPRSNELISVSNERIGFWDLNSGELSRSICVENAYPGRKKLFLSENGRYLVVDCNIHDAPVLIYDMKTLQLLHSCGALLSTQRRVFLSGSLLCRQKSFIDITTGSLVKTMDNFMMTKAYVTCALSSDNKLILIGDQNETKLFEFASEIQIASFAGANPPSVMAITSDNSRAYIGYAENCQFCVFDIDQTSETFGQLLMMFDPKQDSLWGSTGDSRAFAGNEISEISLSPVNQNTVLLNINRFFLICLDTVTGSWTSMKTFECCSQASRPRVYILFSMFSGNGQFVLSGMENLLHLWRPEDGELIHTILLQTMPPFPVAVSRNLVATASNVNTAVRVWDLDNIQESKTPKIRAYEAPVDCISCADQMRLVFVKSQYSLSSTKGFKYMYYFGIDVWNITTGNCREFLPFAKYGRLLQMKVSADATRMALLLNAVDNWYIALIDLKPDGSVQFLKHKKCVSFKVSDDWNFLASFAGDEDSSELKLWDLRKGNEVLYMDNVACPVFMHDGQHFLFIDFGLLASCNSPMVIVYSLQSYVPVCKMPCVANLLSPLPCQQLYFLATRYSSGDSKSEVSLWKISRKSQRPRVTYRDVGSRGILDVSKDGSLGVDGHLQVFDIFSGALRACFQNGTSTSEKEYSIVKLTYDGLYVLWVDDMSVKVGHVATRTVVANASAHERLICLHTMDYGYIIVAGGTDGHLLTMKLAVAGEAAHGQVTYRAQSTEDRRYFLLDTSPCSETAIAKMDPRYQTQPKFLNSDRELPLATMEVQTDLLQWADVPLTVITTGVPSRTGSPFEENSLFSNKRRSSTPTNMSHISNIVHSSALLALLGDDSDMVLPQLITSSSTHNLMNFGTLKSTPTQSRMLQKRSKSAQDLRISSTTKAMKLPLLKIPGKKSQSPGERNHRREPRNSKEKVAGAREEYRIEKAIEMAGSVLMNCFRISPRESSKTSKTQAANLEECVTSM